MNRLPEKAVLGGMMILAKKKWKGAVCVKCGD
jgi:hypothetical protein